MHHSDYDLLSAAEERARAVMAARCHCRQARPVIAHTRTRMWQRACALALSALLAGEAAAPAVASAALVEHFASNGSAEALVSEMTIEPAAVATGTVTYMTYQGPGFDPQIVSYDSSSNAWVGPLTMGVNPLRLDTHGAPAMYFDAVGNLHCIFGSHYSLMWHVRTEEPGAIDRWVIERTVESTGTYPEAVQLPGGDVGVFYRGRWDSWYLRTSEDGTSTFSPAEELLRPDLVNSWYADIDAGSDGRLHVAWVRVDRSEATRGITQARHDAYYMYRDPAGVWRNSIDETLTLPIDPVSAEASCSVFRSAEVTITLPDSREVTTTEVTNEITVEEDADGGRCLMFLLGNGEGDGTFTWRFMRSEEGSQSVWTSTDIARTDHSFDSGTMFPREDGTLEAFLVSDESDMPGAWTARGGGIGKWVSTDHGATWTLAQRHINPPDDYSRFADPQLVEGGSDAARVIYTEWTEDITNFFQRMFLWGESGNVKREVEAEAKRLGGPTRVETALEISRQSFLEGSQYVVIATAADYPDALAGTPLAHALHGPLLLTSAETLSPGIAEEIARLGATRAIILGGTGAVSAAVEKQLIAAGINNLQRLGGNDRYETSLLIARRLRDVSRSPGRAVVVSGRDWPDAVSAAPLASVMECPILLVNGDLVPPATVRAFAEWQVEQCIVVGGTAAVSKRARRKIPTSIRLGGLDRYETALKVAEYGLDHGLLPYRLAFATGAAFPDALCASAFAARVQGPVLLTQPTSLPPSSRAMVEDNAETLTHVYYMGGVGAISETVTAEVGDILGIEGSTLSAKPK